MQPQVTDAILSVFMPAPDRFFSSCAGTTAREQPGSQAQKCFPYQPTQHCPTERLTSQPYSTLPMMLFSARHPIKAEQAVNHEFAGFFRFCRPLVALAAASQRVSRRTAAVLSRKVGRVGERSAGEDARGP
jgi:hypothetical protein